MLIIKENVIKIIFYLRINLIYVKITNNYIYFVYLFFNLSKHKLYLIL